MHEPPVRVPCAVCLEMIECWYGEYAQPCQHTLTDIWWIWKEATVGRPKVLSGPCINGCGRPKRKLDYCDSCYSIARRSGAHTVRRRERLPTYFPNREELAWCAGFIDGEGSFLISGSNCPTLSVPQSGPAAPVILQRVIDALGLGGTVRQHRRRQPHHQQAYRVTITGFERFQAAVVRLWPWLTEPKRQQALEALARYHAQWMPPGARRRLLNEEKRKRER